MRGAVVVAACLSASGRHGAGAATTPALPITGGSDGDPTPLLPAMCGQRSIALDLHGEPKSGTTWLSLLIHSLLALACERADACSVAAENTVKNRFVKTRWSTFPGGCADGEGGALSYNTGHKHTFPASNMCAHDARWSALGLTDRGSAGVSNTFAICDTPGATEGDGVEGCFPPDYVACARTEYNRTQAASRRYVLVMRDPRDIAVSAAFYGGQRDAATRDAYARRTCRVFAGWEGARYFWHVEVLASSTLVLYYEALLLEPLAEVARIGRFLGVPFAADDVEHALHANSASQMKKREEHGDLDPATQARNNEKVRSAGTSTFTSELSNATVDECDARMRELLPTRVNADFARFHELRGRRDRHQRRRRRARRRRRRLMESRRDSRDPDSDGAAGDGNSGERVVSDLAAAPSPAAAWSAARRSSVGGATATAATATVAFERRREDRIRALVADLARAEDARQWRDGGGGAAGAREKRR